MIARHRQNSLLFAVPATLVLATLVSLLAASDEQVNAGAVIQNRVYVKIVLPVEKSEKNTPAVESWISEQLAKKQVRAVTDWIRLPENTEDRARVWNAVVDGELWGCPVSADPVKRMADGTIKVHLTGWAPVPLDQSGMSLPNEIGSRNVAVVDHGKAFVAMLVVPAFSPEQ